MEAKIEKMIPCFKAYGVKRAALFGSMARGEAGAESDVDLLVSFIDRSYDLFDLVGLKQTLEDVLCRSVDIVTYPSLQDDDFARHALRDAQVIYEQD